MNSRNSERFGPHRLLLNLTDKITLKRSSRYVALSNLSICYIRKRIKKSYKINKLKISDRHGIKSLKYLMNYVLYQIFKTTLNIS